MVLFFIYDYLFKLIEYENFIFEITSIGLRFLISLDIKAAKCDQMFKMHASHTLANILNNDNIS